MPSLNENLLALKISKISFRHLRPHALGHRDMEPIHYALIERFPAESPSETIHDCYSLLLVEDRVFEQTFLNQRESTKLKRKKN